MTQVELAYLGSSGLRDASGGSSLSLCPNLARPPVAFDAELRQPVRFREAISALHDIVVCDHRYQKRDRTAYEAYQRGELARQAAIRKGARDAAVAAAEREVGVTKELKQAYGKGVRRYWRLRDQYSRILQREDPTLFRMLVPCDPIVTVADDVCLFEGFSKDESAYGCLSVRRDDGFGASHNLQLGTTNVDYSWRLYDEFQTLRSYRDTRFLVDPEGFTVASTDRPEYREEKIDLPDGWLRGLMQIQAAMAMPSTKVRLTREAVYSLLAYLRRHRREHSPRALRFELIEGRAPTLVLEPWDVRIPVHGVVHDGPTVEPIRIWGRRRLQVLARTLPLADGVTVHLLGTGLPSFWLVHMGEMTLTLGLSGWTTNDWTGASALALLRPPVEPSADGVTFTAGLLQQRGSMTLEELLRTTKLRKAELAAALDHLAYAGQVMHDLADGRYRWRSILPAPVGEAQIGGRDPELAAGVELASGGKVRVTRDEPLPRNARMLAGHVEKVECELVLDAEARIKRAKCVCSHHRRAGIRRGPCRHLIALRMVATSSPGDAPPARGELWQRVVERLFGE